MLAMQYSLTLPADYDMEVIRRRIREKGGLLDGFPGLDFKAYLYAERDGGYSRENLYAPFYLWRDTAGMRLFLTGTGFAGLVDAFGRPAVRSWVPLARCGLRPDAKASWATRESVVIEATDSLEDLALAERATVDVAVEKQGALVALSAFEPLTWTVVRFCFWPATEAVPADGGRQVYRVGYVAHGLAGDDSKRAGERSGSSLPV